MNKDLVKLVKEALAHIGCGPHVMSKLDANSPIVFNFNNGVEMYLAVENEAVWLSSPLVEYSDKVIEQSGAQFLRLTMQPLPFFVTDRVFLSQQDNFLLLCGLVNEAALSEVEQFATALQLFFDMASKLKQVTSGPGA